MALMDKKLNFIKCDDDASCLPATTSSEMIPNEDYQFYIGKSKIEINDDVGG